MKKYMITDKTTNNVMNEMDFALLLYKEGTHIIYCDIEGIYENDGDYYLVDECGNCAWIDPERFVVKRVA